MNIGQEALKIVDKLDMKQDSKPSRGLAVMLKSKDKIADIIDGGGNISTIGKALNLAHTTISKHLDNVMGKGTRKAAKANGAIASERGTAKHRG